MSLPIARARRKKVPSIQRSPNSSTRSHSRDGVGEAEGGDVAGRLELGDLPLVLDQAHLGGDAGEVGVAALVGGDQPVDGRRRRRGGRGSCPPLRAGRLELVDVAHLEAEGVGDLLQRRAAADPQLAVLPVAEELVGVALRARARVEDALAVLDDQHGVAGLVAAEVGVGGVGAEPVVGVVGAHLEGAGRAAPAARPGRPRRAAAGGPRRTARSGAAGGRARGRPSPGA